MELYVQKQRYNDKFYSVTDIVEIAKDVEVEEVDTRYINGYYQLLGDEYDVDDFVKSIKRVQEADLKYPIILYRGYIMDGKHRFAKALLEGKKTIKVKVLSELPIGTNI